MNATRIPGNGAGGASPLSGIGSGTEGVRISRPGKGERIPSRFVRKYGVSDLGDVRFLFLPVYGDRLVSSACE
jgi:hypothetical protein